MGRPAGSLASRYTGCNFLTPNPKFVWKYQEKRESIPSIFKDENTGSCICIWKLAVAVGTYISICIVYLLCLLLLSNGINVGIGHTCNTMRV
jgi:hypothetical protein